MSAEQSGAPATAVCRQIKLSDEARKLLEGDPSIGEYMHRLIEKPCRNDAIRVMAHSLSKRQAVWWGCLCAEHLGPPAGAPEQAALGAAVKWVLDPSEENRRECQHAGGAATLGTPAGCVAMAAFWSGGSMSAPDLPAAAPPDHLTAKTIAGAVLLAANKGSDPDDRKNQALLLGLDVASSKNKWE